MRMNTQVGEMEKARYGEGVWSFHALSRRAILPTPLPGHQPGSSLNPLLLGFYGGFLSKA